MGAMAVEAPVPRPVARALYEGFDYAAFWRDPARAHIDVLEHRLVERLLPRVGRRILDAGCGFGRLADVYVNRFDECVLVDSAWSLLEQARDRWASHVTLVAADLRALPFATGAFDAALAVRVLHHFEDPRPVLAGLRAVLAPGGRLLFTSSNARNPKRILRALLGGEPWSPFRAGPISYDRHTFGWSAGELRDMVTAAGFRVRELRGVGVLDKLVAHVGPVARLVPPGVGVSRPLGALRLAPSLLGAAEVAGAGSVCPAPVLRCPACRVALVAGDAVFDCPACLRAFPLVDGIWDFRL